MAARATNQASDKQQAVVMLEETIAVPKEVSADAGYYSAKTVDDLHGRGVAPFIALEQTRYGRVVLPAPRGRIPSHLSPKDRMGVSYGPDGAAGATLCGCKRWNQSSARSNRVGAPGSSYCGAWRRSKASGR